MADYTPGPWVHIQYWNASNCVASSEDNDVHIAYLHTNNAEANARLIAAAPDLLAALEVMFDWVLSIPGIVGVRADDVCIQARDAIAKARGAYTCSACDRLDCGRLEPRCGCWCHR